VTSIGLLIIPDVWRQLVNGSLFLFKTKQKASLYFTNWRHISAIINKVYMVYFSESKGPVNPFPIRCETNGNQCEHTCVQEQGVVKCTCRDGFVLHENGFSCVGKFHSFIYLLDMNKCEYRPCDHECANVHSFIHSFIYLFID